MFSDVYDHHPVAALPISFVDQPTRDHSLDISRITDQARTENVPPYVPNNITYRTGDCFVRTFADCKDIDITIHCNKGGCGDIELEAIIIGEGAVGVSTPIYCGNMLGSGIIQRIKAIHGERIIVVTKFWTRLRSTTTNIYNIRSHDITFYANDFDLPPNVATVIEPDHLLRATNQGE